jgi:hypothetical protein
MYTEDLAGLERGAAQVEQPPVLAR